MLCSAVCCRPTVCSSRVKGLSSVIEWFDGLKANEFVDMTASLYRYMFVCMSLVLALDLEGVHDLKLHHPSSSVATSNQ